MVVDKTTRWPSDLAPTQKNTCFDLTEASDRVFALIEVFNYLKNNFENGKVARGVKESLQNEFQNEDSSHNDDTLPTIF